MGLQHSLFDFKGTYNLKFNRDVTPYPESEPTFDPHFGFKVPREEKVMIATPEELESANVEQTHRDYCAHHYINFLGCRERETPWIRNCAHEYHAWYGCIYNETIDRFKEYERERRLLVRKKRIEEKKRIAEEKLAAEILSD